MGGEPSGRQVLGTLRCTMGAGHRYTFLRPSRLCDGPFCLFTFFFCFPLLPPEIYCGRPAGMSDCYVRGWHVGLPSGISRVPPRG